MKQVPGDRVQGTAEGFPERRDVLHTLAPVP